MFFYICSVQIILVFILEILSFSWAEELTYRNAIRDTLNHSARIRVKVEDVNVSDATYRQNFAGLYPEISLNSRFERFENLDRREQGFNTIFGEVIGGDVSGWRSSIYLSGQYYLSHWYRKRFEAYYYEQLRDAKIHECAVEVKKLLRELTDIFSLLAEGKIKLKYASEILKRLREVLGLKKQAFVNGQASYEEVLRVETEVSGTEKEMATIRREVKENLERLCSYTGKTYGEDVEVETFVSDGKKEITEFNRIVEETPEYKARLKELEAVKFKAKAAANNFWPDVSLYGRYDYYGSSPNSLDGSIREIRETAYFAGILISLPLFDGGVRKWERKRNMYETQRQEESIKAVREEKGREIKTLHAGYAELSKALKHYRKIADQYGKMLDITKKAHGFGERSLLDIMEMEKDTLTVERDWKVAEHAMAVYEKRLVLEADYKNFMSEYYGNGPYKH
ncbi:MAG: hypothetical protein A2V65_01335 [Deltaproteobacteria bacterium RBG_13_49_15]|nr:MAG: hypothetical protein A2V65_01335 [Deltaproteobacteria bacterium RBG_13_49_15]